MAPVQPRKHSTLMLKRERWELSCVRKSSSLKAVQRAAPSAELGTIRAGRAMAVAPRGSREQNKGLLTWNTTLRK